MPLKCYPLRCIIHQTIHCRITDPGFIIVQRDIECFTGISAAAIFNQDIHIVRVAYHKVGWDLIRVIETLDLRILDLKIGMEEIIIAHKDCKVGMELGPWAPFHLLSTARYIAFIYLYRLHRAIRPTIITFYRYIIELQGPVIIIAISEMVQCVVGVINVSIEPCSVGTGWEVVSLVDPVLCLCGAIVQHHYQYYVITSTIPPTRLIHTQTVLSGGYHIGHVPVYKVAATAALMPAHGFILGAVVIDEPIVRPTVATRIAERCIAPSVLIIAATPYRPVNTRPLYCSIWYIKVSVWSFITTSEVLIFHMHSTIDRAIRTERTCTGRGDWAGACAHRRRHAACCQHHQQHDRNYIFPFHCVDPSFVCLTRGADIRPHRS